MFAVNKLTYGDLSGAHDVLQTPGGSNSPALNLTCLCKQIIVIILAGYRACVLHCYIVAELNCVFHYPSQRLNTLGLRSVIKSTIVLHRHILHFYGVHEIVVT